MKTKILKAKEVAGILQVDVQRVFFLVRSNQLPVIRLGERQYRFSEEAIEQFLHGGGTVKEMEVKINER